MQMQEYSLTYDLDKLQPDRGIKYLSLLPETSFCRLFTPL